MALPAPDIVARVERLPGCSFLVHAAQPHRGRAPRFLAQPPLLPATPLRPDRDNHDPSRVERAIIAALA